jgi:hypothetical protein
MLRRIILLGLVFLFLLLPAMAAAQSAVKLEPAEKKKLDTFFSNFSEVNLKSFNQDSLSREDLLNFALDHIYKNNYKSIKHSKETNSAVIPAAVVDKVTDKYFGRTLPQHAKAEYIVPEASGEAYIFSQVVKLADVGQNRYQAEGVIYLTASGGTPDPHGTPAAWKKAGAEVEQIGKFSALIKKETAGTPRYILLEYQVVMNNP